MEIGLISIMKHVQECKNIRAGAMIVIFNYREDEKQERNKCKTSASESAAFQVLQQPAVADISGRLEEGFWQTQLSLNHHRVMDAAEEGLVTRRGGWRGRGDARCSLLHLQCRWVGMLGGCKKRRTNLATSFVWSRKIAVVYGFILDALGLMGG